MEQDTETLTLMEFLKARLDEDEQAARAALEAAPEPWERQYGDDRWMDIHGAGGTSVVETESGANGPPVEVAEHFYRHRPARVLAEVEAKRAIIELVEDQVDTPYGEPEAFLPLDWLAVLKQLALPYASHEDYREEWRP